jgi:hypothetical protein
MSMEEMTSNPDDEVPQPADDTADWQEPPVPDRFCVHDDESANWVVRKIAEARAYAARCAEWCQREQNRARRTEEFFVRRFGAELEAWARRRIAEQGGRRKSVAVPAGTAGFRAEPPRLVVEDERAVILWAKTSCPEVVQVTEHLRKSVLNDHVRQTGEFPAHGVRWEAARDRFYVK